MILRRLFAGMFEAGLTVVATSNRPPRDLYANGLQRELFLPFIDLVEARCVVHDMASLVDYRQLAAQTLAGHTWMVMGATTSASGGHGGGHAPAAAPPPHGTPLQRAAALAAMHPPGQGAVAAGVDAAWLRCLAGDSETATTLTTQGRSVSVPRAGLRSKAARFTFDELCNRPLGAADYQVLCQHFATVVVDFVPVLTLSNRNELRRFITFVDTAYEHRVKVIAAAAAPPLSLFRPDGATATATAGGAGGGAGGGDADKSKRQYDEAFAFDRTASRLLEMQSSVYLESEWRPQVSSGGVDVGA